MGLGVLMIWCGSVYQGTLAMGWVGVWTRLTQGEESSYAVTNVMGIGGRSGNVCNFFLCFVFLPFQTDLENRTGILKMFQNKTK